jgi:Enoyl-CoA hydratase/carnithine racemase
MSDGDVLVRVDDDVLRVTINRPEKRNPLSRSVLAAIGEAFRTHRDREDLRLAVVTAAGIKSFAAGGDLREVEAIRETEASRQFSNESFAALDAVRRFPLPVVAALNGDALRGRAELAVACDMRLMAAHARIGFIQGSHQHLDVVGRRPRSRAPGRTRASTVVDDALRGDFRRGSRHVWAGGGRRQCRRRFRCVRRRIHRADA